MSCAWARRSEPCGSWKASVCESFQWTDAQGASEITGDVQRKAQMGKTSSGVTQWRSRFC